MKVGDFVEFLRDEIIEEKGCEASILRLDKIHPIISGNKYFKLKYYLEEAIKSQRDTVITFGGYYSNHLHATAFACKQFGLKSIGYVRGSEPATINNTLKDCINYGMDLKFISHGEFEVIQQNINTNPPNNAQIIPMGGNGILGVKGASEIMHFEGAKQFDYVVAAAGTGTMASGLLDKLEKDQHLILISAVKNNFSLKDEMFTIKPSLTNKDNQLTIHFEFHCGGFGKSNQMLFDTMNWFYEQHQIATDFVYTGKMILGFYELLKNHKE